jgi:uncharacterized protein YndB with AHSA1/START domain
MSEPARHVYEVYIRTTPEKLWEAITTGAVTQQYMFGAILQESALAPGGTMTYTGADGTPMIHGNVIEADRPRKLVHTWNGDPHPDEPASRVSWEITPLGDACKLTVVHEHPDAESKTSKGTQEGWPIVLSVLKTLLETGTPLQITWPGA